MNFKRSIYLILTTFLAVGLASCGSSSSDKDKNSDEFKEAEGIGSSREAGYILEIRSDANGEYPAH